MTYFDNNVPGKEWDEEIKDHEKLDEIDLDDKDVPTLNDTLMEEDEIMRRDQVDLDLYQNKQS